MIDETHCHHCQEHDRILRGVGLDEPGLIEQVRALRWVPDAVTKLQGGDIMQGAITEALIRIASAAVLVAVTVAVTRWLA